MDIADWKGFFIPVIIFSLVFFSGCANLTADSAGNDYPAESFREDLAGFPERFIEDSKYTFLEKNNIAALLLAGGASIVMHNTDADDKLQRSFENNRVIDGFPSEALNAIGCPGTHFGITALCYAVAARNKNELGRQRALTMMTALTITGVTTVGLKVIRNNETPNGNSLAWPSGHTSSSFAVASVLDEFYGPRIGFPAYALACLVGYRMIDEGDHWSSDVVFGAALGWVVGHSVAGKDKGIEIAGFRLLPYIATSGDSIGGITLLKRF